MVPMKILVVIIFCGIGIGLAIGGYLYITRPVFLNPVRTVAPSQEIGLASSSIVTSNYTDEILEADLQALDAHNVVLQESLSAAYNFSDAPIVQSE